jgi:hypothetical protein
MRAIKAFNRNLQATLGSGVMTMEAGKTYREKRSKMRAQRLPLRREPPVRTRIL